MMGCLFEVKLSAVLSVGLVRLTEDGIKRLQEYMVVENPAEVCGHHELHSLDWVLRERGPVHVNWQSCRKLSKLHKQRLGRHALNRETNSCQIEVTTHDFCSHHLYQLVI